MGHFSCHCFRFVLLFNKRSIYKCPVQLIEGEVYMPGTGREEEYSSVRIHHTLSAHHVLCSSPPRHSHTQHQSNTQLVIPNPCQDCLSSSQDLRQDVLQNCLVPGEKRGMKRHGEKRGMKRQRH